VFETDKQQILQELEKGRAALNEALAGVDEHLADRKPAAGRWSILECVEHVALGEQFLLSKLAAASRSDHSHENRQREAAIMTRGADRTRPGESPPEARPGDRFHSLDEALSFFDSARAGTIRFVERLSDDPRCWLTNHPLVAGPVSCYEILLMMSVHPVRHAKQITEIRTALAQPVEWS
jgi:hypothetical protein